MVANPDEVVCNTCGRVIAKEHGGIYCNCGKAYCCDSRCIPEYYCHNHSSKTQEISLCSDCEDELMEEIEEEKRKKTIAQNYYLGVW